MNTELSMSATQRPYGMWLQMYQEWLHFVEGIWPHYEDMFKNDVTFSDETFDACWEEFFGKWEAMRQTALNEWATYPVWTHRGNWYALMNRWTRSVIASKRLFSGLINRDLVLPEVWPELDAWIQVFRPWWNHLSVWAEVVDQLHTTTHGTALWRRWEEMITSPVIWTRESLKPLERLNRRVRSLGRDWPEASRSGWFLWIAHASSWTEEWFNLWEAWMLLPMME